jgi:hypothetical protein
MDKLATQELASIQSGCLYWAHLVSPPFLLQLLQPTIATTTIMHPDLVVVRLAEQLDANYFICKI